MQSKLWQYVLPRKKGHDSHLMIGSYVMGLWQTSSIVVEVLIRTLGAMSLPRVWYGDGNGI